MTKISVLMAVYNTNFKLVKRAIDSVLNQSFQDFELFVIDDGSTNDSVTQLSDYCKLHANKINYFYHTNIGQSKSINKGVLNCSGEYITIIDADDEYKKNHLEVCLQEIKDVDLIASTTQTIVDEVENYFVPDKYDTSKVIHVDDCILFATLFGKSEVFKDIEFIDMYAADADFYERASKKYNVKKVDSRTYIYYRNIPSSISAELKNKQLINSAH